MKALQSKECFNDQCPESSNICPSMLLLYLDLCSDENHRTQAKCRKSPQQPWSYIQCNRKQNNFKNKHNIFVKMCSLMCLIEDSIIIFSAAHDICHKAVTNKTKTSLWCYMRTFCWRPITSNLCILYGWLLHMTLHCSVSD